MPLVVRPIGVIHGGLPPRGSSRPRPADVREVEGRIEVFPEYTTALDGLEGFSHMFVLTHLDRRREGAEGLLRVSPHRCDRRALSGKKLRLDLGIERAQPRQVHAKLLMLWALVILDHVISPRPVGLYGESRMQDKASEGNCTLKHRPQGLQIGDEGLASYRL